MSQDYRAICAPHDGGRQTCYPEERWPPARRSGKPRSSERHLNMATKTRGHGDSASQGCSAGRLWDGGVDVGGLSNLRFGAP